MFDVRRANIERFARHLEDVGRARASVARSLSTLAGFYRSAEQDGLLARSPPSTSAGPTGLRVHATGLDRNEVGFVLVAAGLGRCAEHALVSMVAINGPGSARLSTLT